MHAPSVLHKSAGCCAEGLQPNGSYLCKGRTALETESAHLWSGDVAVLDDGHCCSGGAGPAGAGLQGLKLLKSTAGEPAACSASHEWHRRIRRPPLHFCAFGRPGRRPKHLARSCSNSDVSRPAQRGPWKVGRLASMSALQGRTIVYIARTSAHSQPQRCPGMQLGSLGSLSGTGLWNGSSQGAQRLCLAASTAPVATLTAHSTAAQVVTHAGSGGKAHLRQTTRQVSLSALPR